jgi:diguanylate cyclase (GGDEF)-like protein/PAS domain S-box-containing protein
VHRLRLLLPQGHTLPDAAWRQRHHAMVALLVAESIGLTIFSFAEGYSWLHSLAHAAGLLPIAVLALAIQHRRRAAAVLVSLGLVTACALLVHIWHGKTEGHFLFFVTIVVLALYEDWVPFLVAAAYVIVHHGVMGALDPSGVYDHLDAVAHPWKWALIHGAFVIAAGAASVVAWRLNEEVRAAALESEERFKGAFEGAPIGMILFRFGGDGRGVMQVNRAMTEITGHPAEHLVALSMSDVVHPEDRQIVADAVERLGSGEDDLPRFEIRYLHADGRIVWVAVSLSLLQLDLGHAARSGIAQVQDVTEQRRASEEIAYQALHDPLTGLGNRRSLLADLEARLTKATDAEPLMLQLFDLDGFKSYNDTFGHPAGDALLARMATRLRTALEGRATAYRMGGDEFCVLSLPSSNHHETITHLGESALTERGEGFQVTASYGSVFLPAEATSTEALREADRRMYARKSADSRSSAGRQSADVLLRILSERSPALGIHLDEVTGLCEAVATRLGMPEEERAPLLQAASLHDVGKVAVPDVIINKAGPLDDEEIAFMRRHTLIGERILSAAPALTRAASLVRWSHERFDGDGYPDGLKGEEIPLGSRIIAVCDSYDAMVSDRPYRDPMTTEEARAELRRCAGTQFDPVVVEIFCDVQLARERAPMGAVEELA